MRFVLPRLTGRRLPPLTLTLTFIALAFALTLWAQREEANDGMVRVREFRPQDSTDPRTNITITFSDELVSPDRLDQPVTPPVAFEPAIAGVARWVEPNVLRIFPDAPLSPATTYTARIASDSTWLEGRRIREKREFSFHTPPLTVTSVSSYTTPDETRPELLRLYVDVRFNYPVTVSEFIGRMEITARANTAHTGDLEHGVFGAYNSQQTAEAPPVDEVGQALVADLITLVSEPFASSENEQYYLLTVASGLGCPGCGTPLSKKYTSDLVVPPREQFVVHGLDAYVEGTRGVLALNFSTMVSADGAEEYLAVDPALPFRVEQQWSRLLLRGEFEPGETYTVSIEPSLRSLAGSSLGSDFSGRVSVPDVPPTVVFRSEGIFLPRGGTELLEIETINVDTLSVEVEQIFANNLVYALAGGHTDSYTWGNRDFAAVGRRLLTAKKVLDGTKNERLSTTIDAGAFIADTARGVYKISVRSASQRWSGDSRLAMVTDLGLVARMSGDYLMVWVNRLSDVTPVRGVTINLYSKNNQLLLSGKTDSRGTVLFEEIAETIGAFEPYVITAEHDGDLAYLRFTDTQLPLADFDVKGRPFLERGYEAFVYTDRGVYRPGETAHLASIVRESIGDVPREFPYLLVVQDPAGREFQTFRLSTGGDAFSSVDLLINDYARTGKYTAVARIGNDLEIGRVEFQVEEFVPDRIKVTVATPRNEVAAGETMPITVTGAFLFGAPAADHQVTGRIQLETHRFTPKNFTSYNFSDSQRKFAARSDNLEDARLNREGEHVYRYSVPREVTPPSALKGLIGASVSEQGGRAVSGYTELIVHPYPRYLGLRLDFEGYVKPGEEFAASVVAVNPDGGETSLSVANARLYRVAYNSVLSRTPQGRYRYTSERSESPVEEQSVAIPTEGATIRFTAQERGLYRLVVEDSTGGHAADAEFYVSGWGYAPWSMEQPERIEIGLDKTQYRPGENAVVQVRSPFGGKLLLTIENETVLESMVLDVAENTAEVTLKVKEDFFPNVYVTATVIKKADDINRAEPARAFGIAPILLSKGARDLQVSLAVPEAMQPRRTLSVEVRTGVPGKAQVTVAAVDAGILQLTGFATPNPLEFFYGQRSPSLKAYDVYSFIYPNIQPSKSHLAPGGDRFFEAARKRHLNPFTALRVKPVALWSGIITTDETGRATVPLEVPQFNGRLVVMAVAVHGNRFGSATREVTVRENLIVQESFPRFVSPNDVVTGLATVFNYTGEEREVSVELALTGPAEVTGESVQRMTMGDGAEQSATFPMKVGLEPGVIGVHLRATAGTDQTEVAFELPNRPAQPLKTEFGAGVITDSTAARFVLPTGYIESTTQLVLQTSSLTSVQFKGSVEYLLRYPYGCVEQTTSRVFPLLYFESLARFADPNLIGGNSANYFIQEGVRRLGTLVRADGTFSFWPGGNIVNPWASVYAGHFLLEARQAGYVVDNDLYELVRRRLHSWARGRDLTDADLPVRAYAAYALASCEELDRKTLNELRQINVVALPLSAKFHLAGAMALAGDRSSAFAIIDPIDIQPAIFPPETGGDFSSGVRTNAIMLDVLARIEPESPSAAVLAHHLMQDARAGHWYTTQENAFALMALGRYLKGRAPAKYSGTISIDGEPPRNFTNDGIRVALEDIIGREVEIGIDGDGECYYYWQLSGVSSSHAAEEFNRGIKVTREYLDAGGNPLVLDSIPLGTQVICRIEAVAEREHLHNVVINDLLPAGLAVENPRLKSTPRLAWIPKGDADITHSDIRDDRVLLFVDLKPGKPIVYHYSLRAIAAGEFTIPPVAAECMYNPLIAGAASSGRLRIARQE